MAGKGPGASGRGHCHPVSGPRRTEKWIMLGYARFLVRSDLELGGTELGLGDNPKWLTCTTVD